MSPLNIIESDAHGSRSYDVPRDKNAKTEMFRVEFEHRAWLDAPHAVLLYTVA